MWVSQVEALSRLGHRCCTIDLRGHGGTPELFEPTNIEVHKADVMETLAGLDLHLPGHICWTFSGRDYFAGAGTKKSRDVRADFCRWYARARVGDRCGNVPNHPAHAVRKNCAAPDCIRLYPGGCFHAK